MPKKTNTGRLRYLKFFAGLLFAGCLLMLILKLTTRQSYSQSIELKICNIFSDKKYSSFSGYDPDNLKQLINANFYESYSKILAIVSSQIHASNPESVSSLAALALFTCNHDLNEKQRNAALISFARYFPAVAAEPEAYVAILQLFEQYAAPILDQQNRAEIYHAAWRVLKIHLESHSGAGYSHLDSFFDVFPDMRQLIEIKARPCAEVEETPDDLQPDIPLVEDEYEA